MDTQYLLNVQKNGIKEEAESVAIIIREDTGQAEEPYPPCTNFVHGDPSKTVIHTKLSRILIILAAYDLLQ